MIIVSGFKKPNDDIKLKIEIRADVIHFSNTAKARGLKTEWMNFVLLHVFIKTHLRSRSDID